MKRTFVMNLNKANEFEPVIVASNSTTYNRPIGHILRRINNSTLYLEIDNKPAVVQRVQIFDHKLYGTGYIATSQGAFHVAVFWENDACTRLTDGTLRATANGIHKRGQNIYIAGHEGNNAVYWINGQKYILTKPSMNPNIATDITIEENSIYVSGHIFTNNRFVAGYWNNNCFNEVFNSTSDSFCSSITMIKHSVALCGYSNIHHRIQPFFWSNHQIQFLELPNDCQAVTTGIRHTQDNVYVLGCLITSNGDQKACFWKNGKIQILYSTHSSCSALELYFDNEHLYFIGSYANNKNKTERILTYWEV